MTLQLELYQFLVLLTTALGAVVGTVKVLWARIEKSLDQKYEATDTKLREIQKQGLDNQDGLRKLEREFLQHLALLPERYVRFEDYMRGQTVIEAKLDAVAEQLKTVQINQGVQRG